MMWPDLDVSRAVDVVEDTFRYRLHSPDGDDLGEATYAQVIHPDEEIIAGSNQRFRVVDVVPLDDKSPFVGLLQVEAA